MCYVFEVTGAACVPATALDASEVKMVFRFEIQSQFSFSWSALVLNRRLVLYRLLQDALFISLLLTQVSFSAFKELLP